MPSSLPEPRVVAAFAAIYLVWGSTFLAIRVGVREVPPLVFACMRFFTAGAVLYGGMRLQGTPSPNRSRAEKLISDSILRRIQSP